MALGLGARGYQAGGMKPHGPFGASATTTGQAFISARASKMSAKANIASVRRTSVFMDSIMRLVRTGPCQACSTPHESLDQRDSPYLAVCRAKLINRGRDPVDRAGHVLDARVELIGKRIR